MHRCTPAICFFSFLALGSCARDDHTRHENNSIPPSRAVEQGLPSNPRASVKTLHAPADRKLDFEDSANYELDKVEAHLVRLKGELDHESGNAAICNELEQLHKQILQIRLEAGRSRIELPEERPAKMEQTQLAIARLSQRVELMDQRIREFSPEQTPAQP